MTLQELITALQEIATTQSPALPTNIARIEVRNDHWRVVRLFQSHEL